jgi:hypothetical protein
LRARIGARAGAWASSEAPRTSGLCAPSANPLRGLALGLALALRLALILRTWRAAAAGTIAEAVAATLWASFDEASRTTAFAAGVSPFPEGTPRCSGASGSGIPARRAGAKIRERSGSESDGALLSCRLIGFHCPVRSSTRQGRYAETLGTSVFMQILGVRSAFPRSQAAASGRG